ncbi:MAG: sporulation transcriptional regulator SpoIIID [Bacilli bacterium]|nr:sporulation transcriptional regulator SpoIIID [Bacilli bacterium]
MAKFTDEERIEITKEIANYIIDNSSSTRKTAEHFKISNATVSTLMNELLPRIDSEKYLKVQNVLNSNKPKTITDEIVKQRVLKAAELIKEGFTAEEIASSMGVTINAINEDLETRLLRISESLYNDIKEIQEINSRENLILGSNMTVEGQKRDENGKFTK